MLSVNIDKKIFKFRKIVQVIIPLIFALSLLKVSIFVGSLSGSSIFKIFEIIDLFGFIETTFATKFITLTVFLSVIPVLLLYLIFGRAFCGWVCPFDLLFDLIARIKRTNKAKTKVRKSKLLFIPIFLFLFISFILGVPIFTRYLSHLTNFFRVIYLATFIWFNYPYEFYAYLMSFTFVVALLIFEYLFPRFWCKNICPVGITYGFLNKASLLKLKLVNLDDCKFCFTCQNACYMDVPIMEKVNEIKNSNKNSGILQSTNCVFCGECLFACDKIKKIKVDTNIKLGFSFNSFEGKIIKKEGYKK